MTEKRSFNAIRALYLCAGIAVAAPLSGTAAAQDDPFGSIEYRARPEYRTPPMTVGSFEILPQLDVQAEAIDRVFAGRGTSASDLALTIRPRVLVADRREDRIILLDLATGLETYVDGTAGDRIQALARGSIRLGLNQRTRPFAGFEVNLNDTSGLALGDGTTIAQPIKLFTYRGNAGVEQDFGPVTARLEGRYSNTEYNNDLLYRDVLVDGGFRDYENYGGTFRLSYSANEAQRFYVQGDVARFDYYNAGTAPFPGFIFQDRSADNYGFRLGYERRLTELLQFDVSMGYATQKYDNPVIDDIQAFVAQANIYYSPTQLTRVRLNASRSIDETINPLFSSFLQDQVTFSVEHELQRNMVIGGRVRYADYSADDGFSLGDEYEVAGFARYFLSPSISLLVRGSYFDRTGFFEGSQTRVLIGATYNF